MRLPFFWELTQMKRSNTSILLATAVLLVLAGCASRPSLEELEAEAAITGDFSRVERYNRVDRAMNKTDPNPVCKNGYVLVCHTKSELENCNCNSPLNRRVFQ